MTYQKTFVAVATAVVLAATGGTTTFPTTAPNYVDVQTALAIAFDAKLSNGATGPTTVANIQVQVSEDAATWFNAGGPLVGITSNNGVAHFGALALPDAAQFVRFAVVHPTGQTVTLDIQASYLEDV